MIVMLGVREAGLLVMMRLRALEVVSAVLVVSVRGMVGLSWVMAVWATMCMCRRWVWGSSGSSVECDEGAGGLGLLALGWCSGLVVGDRYAATPRQQPESIRIFLYPPKKH